MKVNFQNGQIHFEIKQKAIKIVQQLTLIYILK